MDLKQQIDQLDEVIKNYGISIMTLKEKKKEAERKHKQYSKLLLGYRR